MTKRQIGNFVRQQREIRGLTQQQLASKSGVRRQTVYEIENAVNGYAIDKLLQVVEAMGAKLRLIAEEVFIFRARK